jgi:hypothetical protein
MKFIRDTIESRLIVGEEYFSETVSILFDNFHVVFEDDKTTGYIYVLDTKNLINENPIQDALHIYNVEDVADGNLPSEINFLWSEDGYICIFLINNYPHAVINFKEKYCFCRSGFPPNDKKSMWSKDGHNWNEEIFMKIKNM